MFQSELLKLDSILKINKTHFDTKILFSNLLFVCKNNI